MGVREVGKKVNNSAIADKISAYALPKHFVLEKSREFY
jgi:hypothetical protein